MDGVNNVVNLGIVKTYNSMKFSFVYLLYVNGYFHDSYDSYEDMIREIECLAVNLEV